MEKLLTAFASGLQIQYLDKDTGKQAVKPASQEQMDALKDEILKHLSEREKMFDIGDFVTYDYYRARIRGGKRPDNERLVESPNANLGGVMSNLPKLPDGENYAFPEKTFLTIKIIKVPGGETKFEPVKVCLWLYHKMQ